GRADVRDAGGWLRPARAGGDAALSARSRALAAVSGARRGTWRAAALRRARLRRVSALRRARARPRAPGVQPLRSRDGRRLLVQAPGLLSLVPRPPDGRHRRSPGRRGVARGARPPMGLLSAVGDALDARVR